MSDVTTGFGAQFWLKVGSGTLTEVGEIIALNPGGAEWSTFEKTHMKSTNRVQEFGKALNNPGTGDFQINWMPGNVTDDLITAAVASVDPCEYKIVYPGTATNPAVKDEGDVLVLSRTPSVPIGDRMTCGVSLQFTGERTEGAAA